MDRSRQYAASTEGQVRLMGEKQEKIFSNNKGNETETTEGKFVHILAQMSQIGASPPNVQIKTRFHVFPNFVMQFSLKTNSYKNVRV